MNRRTYLTQGIAGLLAASFTTVAGCAGTLSTASLEIEESRAREEMLGNDIQVEVSVANTGESSETGYIVATIEVPTGETYEGREKIIVHPQRSEYRAFTVGIPDDVDPDGFTYTVTVEGA